MPMTITRKAFLQMAASTVPGWAWSRPVVAQGQPSRDGARRDRLTGVFRAYQDQGIHRTATAVDGKSGRWLAGEATKRGADVTARPFTVDRLDIKESFVEAGGSTLEALPFFDGGFTTPAGVTGRLGAPDSGAPVALVSLDQSAIGSEGTSLADLRRSNRVRAVVAITKGASPGLCPSNARSFAQPYGVPVAQVSSSEEERLGRMARDGAEVRVVASVERTRTTADNVLASVQGRRPDLPPVIVMTPRSGWWRCASERGGGIACWLEAIGAVAGARPDRTVRFIASSGHELGHLGLESFLHEEAALIAGAAAWVHLGANIGAAGGVVRLQSSSDEIEAIVSAALERADAPLGGRVPRGRVLGEARNIHAGGGRYVSLLGTNPLFHNPDDLWPAAVDLPVVESYAAATSDLVLKLASA